VHLARALPLLLLLPLAGCPGEPPSVIASTSPAPSAAPSAQPPPAIDASAPAASAITSTAVAREDYFRVDFEQSGAAVPLHDHDITLAAKPFVIALRFRSPDSVHVSASTSPRWFDVARTGGAFDLGNSNSKEAPFAVARGMAENLVNPDPQLFLSDQASHFWFYEDDKTHRCNTVTKGADGIVCRRRVERVGSGDPIHFDPIASYAGKSIYLVFLGATDGTDAADWTDRVERQRAYFRVTIR
jgi:hypothetical protein